MIGRAKRITIKSKGLIGVLTSWRIMNRVEKITTRDEIILQTCCCCSFDCYSDDGFRSQAIYFNDYAFIQSGSSIERCEGGITPNCLFCGECHGKVQIRNSGNGIVFMPDFQSVGADEQVWYMSIEHYKQLREIDNEFPPVNEILTITKEECALIFIHETSYVEKLDNFYFDNDLYLNTDASEGKEIINILKMMLKDYEHSLETVMLQPASEENEITIILDTPDYFEWKPLCKADKGYTLRLESGYQVLKEVK